MAGEGLKECRSCGMEKPFEDYYKHDSTADGRSNYCIPCLRRRNRDRYYRRRAGDHRVERLYGSTRHYHLKRRYDIGAEEWGPGGSRCEASDLTGVMAKMIENQGQVCKICLRKPADHVDHDHATGEVRGVLCFTCNVGLGNFTDDPELMQRGINYLRGAAWPSILRESPGVYRLCS